MSEISTILRRAADLIEPEGAWAQGTYARGRTGRGVRPEGDAAVCWCVVGALQRVEPRSVRKALTAMRDQMKVFIISDWNDALGRTQAEVVAALRAAAERADHA